MRVFLFILSVLIFALSGCGDKNRSENERQLHNAKNLEEANASFYRIQASYEVIETEERIDFDFIVSAYNREVPGSFAGVFMPQFMFKATSDGAAISINPPRFYYSSGFKRPPSNTPFESIPLMMWYPDVNDLGFGITYVTSEAYHSPNAKVKFIDYKVTPSNRKAFHAFAEKEKAEYKQIGAIPGPFGCVTNNTAPSKPMSCAYKGNRARNNGRVIVVPDNRFAAFETIWPEGALEVVNENMEFPQRYICNINIDFTDSKWQGFRGLIEELPEENRNAVWKAVQPINDKRNNERGGSRWAGANRDAKTARGEADEIFMHKFYNRDRDDTRTEYLPVTRVYPLVYHKHPRWHTKFRMSTLKGREDTKIWEETNFTQIITDTDWYGFRFDIEHDRKLDNYGVPRVSNFRSIEEFIPEFKPPDFDGKVNGTLFFGDVQVCVANNAFLQTNFVDTQLGRTISLLPTF